MKKYTQQPKNEAHVNMWNKKGLVTIIGNHIQKTRTTYFGGYTFHSQIRVLFSYLFVVFILFSGCVQENYIEKKAIILFNSSNVSIIAEKANTEEKRQNGLMWRDELKENDGMLFYFNKSDYHAFWMANTKIPLEAIFIDENFTIVDIVEMEPCREKLPAQCKIYSPIRYAKYVLEVNQNFSKRYGLKINDKIRIE